MQIGVTYDNPILIRIRELMIDEGYYELADTRRDGLVESIIYCHKSLHYSCVIRPNNDPSCVTFELTYGINPGAFTLTSNECGSLFNIDHFRQQELYMEKYIRIIEGGK